MEEIHGDPRTYHQVLDVLRRTPFPDRAAVCMAMIDQYPLGEAGLQKVTAALAARSTADTEDMERLAGGPLQQI